MSDDVSGCTTRLVRTGRVNAISATSLASLTGRTKTCAIDADTVTVNGGKAIDTITTGDTMPAESLRERGTGRAQDT